MMDGVSALDLEDKLKDQLALAFPKDSKLTGIFNAVLLDMMQNGVMDKLTAKWLRKKYSAPNRWESIPSSGLSLGFLNLSFPFLVLTFGIGVSMLISLFEVKVKRILQNA